MVASEPQLSIGVILSELVTASGILRHEIVDEAKIHASQSGLPIGRVLVMSGHLGEGDLTSALRASQMVRDRKLTRRQAAQALLEAYNQCMPFDQVVDEVLDYPPATRLGQLLVTAGIVPIVTIAKLEERTKEGGVVAPTLGQQLTRYGIISPKLLGTAIELLMLIRNSRVTIDQAAKALRATCASNVPADIALEKITGERSEENQLARLGLLLRKADIATEDEILIAAEIGAETNQPIGEILLGLGMVEETLLQAALTVQGMIAVGTLGETQGLEILHQVRTQGLPVDQVLDELRALKKKIVEFLKVSVLINDKDIQSAIELYPGYAHDVVRALISSEIIDLQTVKNAVRCLAIMQARGISEDTAAAALRHSHRNGMAIEQAIQSVLALDRPLQVPPAGIKIVETVHNHFAAPPLTPCA